MNKSNQKITFQGKPLRVTGREVHEGDPMPAFKLTGVDMSDIDSASFKGKVLVLSVVPSLDTSTCALQTKRFNQEAEKLSPSVQILTVSMDLPFAQKRWCGAEGATRIMTGSDYKYRGFGETFGVYWTDMALLARAVFVVDKGGVVRHVEYVANLSDEPDYAAVLAKVRELAA
ncbi:MAG: thiol peroxidase [Bdellovibrionota bacterium]|nr:MAG: thiol peroxidase [Bdellovibrionota bacterium]